jgi:predicted dehydrogenase
MQFDRRKFLKTTTAAGLFTFIPAIARSGLAGRTSLDDIQLGVIGTGRRAVGLVRTLSRLGQVRIVAACDVAPFKLAAFSETCEQAYADSEVVNPGVRIYANYRDLVRHDGLDAVLVATPDHQHVPICIAALEQGLHVYCEKPLAHTIEEGRALVEATERAGKVLQTGSQQRSMANFQRAVKLIHAGELGEVREVLVSIGVPPRPFDLPAEPLPEGVNWSEWIGPSVYRPYHSDLLPQPGRQIWPKWRDFAEFGGGMITDWGAHMFDIVQWALQKDTTGPVRFTPDPTQQQAGLSFEYADGCRVVHERFLEGNAVRFVGSEGNLEVSRGFLRSSIEGLIPAEQQEFQDGAAASERQLAEFFAAIRTGSAVSCPVEVGHRSSSVCTLANIAYRLRRPLEFDPATERITNDDEAAKLLGPAYRLSLGE